MKILILSNFYPPHHIGGYGMLCMEVAEGLANHGHTFKVLTSQHGVDNPTVDGHIYRFLSLESDIHFYKPGQGLRYPSAKRRNLAYFHQLITSYQPDLIFIWGMWSLSKELAAEAERIFGSRVIYYMANPWPIEPNMHQVYWDEPAHKLTRRPAKMAMRIPARILLRDEWKSVPLQFEHAPCCSEALRTQLLEANVILQDAPVIYEGIDLALYLAQSDQRPISQRLRLLFVGILAKHKGVHTIIEALTLLSPTQLAQTELTIVGSGHPEYEAYLRKLVVDNDLSEYITFHPPIPRSELPAMLGEFDVLLLPSTWEEPLARIMQEGLASGAVVVGSATGGTKEIIINEENGLLFPAENSRGLANALNQLMDDPNLRRKLAENGRQTAIEKFDIVRMVREINSYILNVVKDASPTISQQGAIRSV